MDRRRNAGADRLAITTQLAARAKPGESANARGDRRHEVLSDQEINTPSVTLRDEGPGAIPVSLLFFTRKRSLWSKRDTGSRSDIHRLKLPKLTERSRNRESRRRPNEAQR